MKCSTTDKSQGKTVFEANLRAVVAFREIGKGFSGMEKFTKCMNMFSMTNNSFSYLQKKVAKEYKNVAIVSMKNANECLNSLVWQKCPKSVFVTREVFETAVYSAVLHFNDRGNGIREVLSSFGCDGFVTAAKTQKQDILRITRMEYKSRQPVKERRKTLRTIKKGYLDIENQKE